MSARLIIFETHPIQYRAPVYQELQKMLPDAFKVVFGSDCSVRGHVDREFGQQIAWDIPLLEGYPNVVLNNDRGLTMSTWRSLHGAGIFELLRQEQPKAVLMNSFAYLFGLTVYLSCMRLRIPVWIRMDNQDEAFERTPTKAAFRSFVYRVIYRGIAKAFCVGELNRQHYLKHGLKEEQLRFAHHCTPDRFLGVSVQEKSLRRAALRARFGIAEDQHVIGFFGKLIPKKDPGLLLAAWKCMSEVQRTKTSLLFVGSGELEEDLKRQCRALNINAVFAGFINQSELPDYYLSTDTVVLPSRRMGETWGLVVNEALQAGCGVVVSNAVGCYRNFELLPRFCVIQPGAAQELADAISALRGYARDFDWARGIVAQYSVQAAARALAEELVLVTGAEPSNENIACNSYH